ncbi:MAG: hypothetical protein Q8M16_16460 [Pirellulaceae bacterium]|nr:hypothetical protein [Pirellulaceae bacterium]
MSRLLGFLVVLSLLIGCNSTIPSVSDQESSATIPHSSTANTMVDASLCEKWKESTTYVLARTLVACQLLRDDAAYATQLEADVPALVKIDVAELRRHLQVVASIPDPSSDSSLLKPSQVVREYAAAFDLLEANLAAKTPFANGQGDGQRLQVTLESLYMKGAPALSEAVREYGCGM